MDWHGVLMTLTYVYGARLGARLWDRWGVRCRAASTRRPTGDPVSAMEFAWDPAEDAANLARHGIAFGDAIGIFAGPVFQRRTNDDGEERWIAVGVAAGREIAVTYARHRDRHRIISAREASEEERRAYRSHLARR